MKTALYSEPEKIAQAQLARVLMRRASGKMLAEAAGFEAWDRLTDEQAQDFKSAASIMMWQMGSETHAKALALKRGIEWGSLDLAGRAKMVSAAMSELGHLGAEAHTKALALTRGVEWGSLDQAGRKEMTSAAMSELKLVSKLRKRTEATEACARKIAQSEGKDWGSMWLLTQVSASSRSYRDEAETVCQKCYYVGGSAPLTQKDAFHNLLTGAVRHWMGEDYWGD
mmetsp:Transcript_80135/g.117415  ORF Transcript_80135/g.117415 Transcript_80135/m.117415 type:complete len:226 (-) Transcript_80135:682-1359(-)